MTDVENGLLLAKSAVRIGLLCFAVYMLGPAMLAFYERALAI